MLLNVELLNEAFPSRSDRRGLLVVRPQRPRREPHAQLAGALLPFDPSRGLLPFNPGRVTTPPTASSQSRSHSLATLGCRPLR